DRELHDKYGRWLAHIYLARPGRPDLFVNARLITAGYARTLSITPNTAHAKRARGARAESGARGARIVVGLRLTVRVDCGHAPPHRHRRDHGGSSRGGQVAGCAFGAGRGSGNGHAADAERVEMLRERIGAARRRIRDEFDTVRGA